MRILQPTTPEDIKAYFQLRWEVLRKPWGQPKGSEQDEYEDIAYHLMAINDDGLLVGAGRLHPVNSDTAQIRYMAVTSQARNQGIGAKIISGLEQQARRQHRTLIILNARDSALSFYQHHGYHSVEKGHALYDQITHTKMQKKL